MAPHTPCSLEPPSQSSLIPLLGVSSTPPSSPELIHQSIPPAIPSLGPREPQGGLQKDTFTHLPGYVEQAGALKAKGVELIACLAVNDVFVMSEWGKAHGAQGKVRMLADPTGAFGKATELLLDKETLRDLFGTNRCKRFSMVLENGVVKALNVEEDGTGLTCSLANNILSQL
ncbi:peroxiredoxin-5, mitochondrial isoform X2 [Mauremys reevesii]|uniref:peroxiredoxin-5, mitochondrial isoform X2 n=1 Tax=Mauremys reevesii TaxID=260615 RepID=UPI00193F7EF9|nr:peroxiredoxin-5, mitochondrial isoform X2 [Mauremys reevesii]